MIKASSFTMFVLYCILVCIGVLGCVFCQNREAVES